MKEANELEGPDVEQMKQELYRHITERAFTAQIIEMARRFNWLVAHFMILNILTRRRARKRFEKTLTDWEKVFYNSKANGAEYNPPPEHPREWPEGWLTKRRRELGQ